MMRRLRKCVALLVVSAACTCANGTKLPDGGLPPGPGCTRLTCESDMCGALLDGCTGILRCPACDAGLTCGGDGRPNHCGSGACEPQTCTQLAVNCDLVSDGCAKVLDCG